MDLPAHIRLSPPKAILFDIGNTILKEEYFDLEAGIQAIVHDSPELVTELADAFREELAAYHHVHRELHLASWLREQYQPCRTTPVEIVENTIWEVVVKLVPLSEIGTVLTYLSNKNILLGAVSNAAFSGQALAAELENHGLRHYFRCIISSGDIGMRKPHISIYETALRQIGSAPEQTWFIGDTLTEDITGAIAAELQPFWFSDSIEDMPADIPAIRIRNWTDFLHLYKTVQNKSD